MTKKKLYISLGQPKEGGYTHMENTALNAKLRPRFNTNRWPGYAVMTTYFMIRVWW
jgi:hypothetical protein